ncbi:hypothetical protein BpHYR1_039007 [Brachionus plicatilis]|uniref:Uncharacterized protein n=1 Tax=Brachionus plicatilis TaxID=10195 RepID=A0A3M7T1I9_BRAPC|nr:hypothetical protein BpHYR1_039007 [Brachionus plicatilis]
MNERTTFNLIFDKNSNKCDKNNGTNNSLNKNFNIDFFIFNCNSNKNELIVFMFLLFFLQEYNLKKDEKIILTQFFYLQKLRGIN